MNPSPQQCSQSHQLVSSVMVGVIPLEFELQAIIDLNNTSVYAREMLYRGNHPENWLVLDTNVLAYLTLRQASPEKLFVNVSNETMLHLDDQIFLDAARANNLHYELNEAALSISKFEYLAEKVNRLSQANVRFAIDDFGAGFDGIRRLCALDRVDCVKLDMGLLRAALQRSHAKALIKNLVTHWRDTGINIIAEGIETPELMDLALSLGVNMVQGFYVDMISTHKPQPLHFPALLYQSNPINF